MAFRPRPVMDKEDSAILADLFEFPPPPVTDKDGNATLTDLFGLSPRRRNTSAKQLFRSTSSVKKRQLSRASIWRGDEWNRSSPWSSVRKGDFVWVKIFPYTWWPGRVESFWRSLPLVSLFGCQRTFLPKSSEICGFEEYYPRRVGNRRKLSDEIVLALEEMARSIVLALKCPCAVAAVDDDGTLALKRDLDPSEILHFVLDKAVSPQVASGEIATAVRISAELNSFRCSRSICKISGVDKRFCPEGIIGFVLDMAINSSLGYKDIDCLDRAVAQLNAFRRFSSVKPDWFYQPDSELNEDSFPSCNFEELPGYLYVNEIATAMTRDPDDDVQVELQEECEVLEVNSKQEGREICGINRIDLGLLDMDGKDDCLFYNQPQVDGYGNKSTGSDVCRNTSYATQHSVANCSPKEVEVDAEFLPGEILAIANDANVSIPTEVCSTVDRELVPSDRMPNKCKYVVFNGSKVENSHDTIKEGHTGMLVNHENCNSAEVPLSSVENPLALAIPGSGGWLRSFSITKSSTYCPMEASELSIEPRYSVVRCSSISYSAQRGDLITQITPIAETVCKNVTKKSRLNELIASGNDALNKSIASCSGEILARSAPLIGEIHSKNDNHVNQKTLPQDEVGSNPIKLPLPETHTKNSEVKRKKGNSGFISKYRSFRKKQFNDHIASKWQTFYASPLTKDEMHLNNTTPRSSVHNSLTSASASLNMKFPKHFALPSKEDLEKKFRVFGPLDHSRTRIFFYTGAAKLVFLHQTDAVAAYNYVTRKNIFGQANVRFWIDKYENHRKECSDTPGSAHSSLNLKSCLRKSATGQLSDKKNLRVRFAMDLHA